MGSWGVELAAGNDRPGEWLVLTLHLAADYLLMDGAKIEDADDKFLPHMLVGTRLKQADIRAKWFKLSFRGEQGEHVLEMPKDPSRRHRRLALIRSFFLISPGNWASYLPPCHKYNKGLLSRESLLDAWVLNKDRYLFA